MPLYTPPDRWVALINNQSDHSSWAPSGAYIAHFDYGGVLPCTWIEHDDPAFLVDARALVGGQCFSSGTRHMMLMDHLHCIDIFRVHVRPEHIDALAALKGVGTVQQYAAAVDALVAECGYPPAP